MTQAERNSAWRKRYSAEVERSIEHYNWLNQQQPVHTRQMTEEEYEEYFGEKPESIHKLKENNNEQRKKSDSSD